MDTRDISGSIVEISYFQDESTFINNTCTYLCIIGTKFARRWANKQKLRKNILIRNYNGYDS